MATAKDYTGFNDVVAGDFDTTYATTTMDGELRTYSQTFGTGDFRDDNIVSTLNFDGPEVALPLPGAPDFYHDVGTAFYGDAGNDTLSAIRLRIGWSAAAATTCTASTAAAATR